MILSETICLLKELHGDSLNDLRIERIVVGLFFTGVKLSDGSGGVVYTPAVEIHSHQDGGPMAIERPAPKMLKGMPVSGVLDNQQPGPLGRLITSVLINALSVPFLTPERYGLRYGTDVLDSVNLEPGTRVGMVGAIRPFLKRLKEMPGIELMVVEQKRENLKAEEVKYYVPAEAAAKVLPTCDTVIITGAAISNGTIDGLLSWITPGTRAIVTGPTASMLPDSLFSRNVSEVSGVALTDADLALDMLAEGAIAYHLFNTCMQKMNVTRKTDPSSGRDGCDNC